MGGGVLPRSASTNACISALWPLSCPQPRACDLFAAVANEFEPPKIFEDRDRATAEDFHALLRSRLVAVGEIADRAQRAVRELERCDDVIHAVLARIAHGLRLHFDGARAREKAEKIDKMADLAENASASLLGIVDPMIGGNVARIHAVVDGQRFVDLRQKLFQSARPWARSGD